MATLLHKKVLAVLLSVLSTAVVTAMDTSSGLVVVPLYLLSHSLLL